MPQVHILTKINFYLNNYRIKVKLSLNQSVCSMQEKIMEPNKLLWTVHKCIRSQCKSVLGGTKAVLLVLSLYVHCHRMLLFPSSQCNEHRSMEEHCDRQNCVYQKRNEYPPWWSTASITFQILYNNMDYSPKVQC
jgi:hypothetical protein